ncbi:hypothetical protein AKJ16_DCAP03229 [Drosera capensis]
MLKPSKANLFTTSTFPPNQNTYTSVQKMVLCYPSTPKKLAMTVACFLGGASLFYVGLQLSHKNIAPQQARIKARNDFVRERLKQKYGYEGPTLRKD